MAPKAKQDDSIGQVSNKDLVRAPSTTTTLTMLPHKHQVIIEPKGNHLDLLHLITTERYTLPQGTWELLFDDDGFGGLSLHKEDGIANDFNADNDTIMVEDVLKYTVYKDETGGYGVAGAEDQNPLPLTKLLEKFQDGVLHFKLGDLQTQVDVDFALFSWARSGATLYWSLKSIHSELKFHQFPTEPWRWASQNVKRWSKTLLQLGFSGHLLQSTEALPWENKHYSLELAPSTCTRKSKNIVGNDAPVLPWNGISCTGLFFILGRWSSTEQRNGGFAHPSDRQTSNQLLRHLLANMWEAGKATEFQITLVHQWQCQWPKQYMGGRVVTISADQQGRLDFTPLQNVAREAGSKSLAQNWLHSLAQHVGVDWTLERVLIQGSSTKVLQPLHAQLCFQLGQRLQDILTKMLKGKEGKVLPGFVAERISMDHVIDESHHLGYQLMRYVDAAKDLVERSQCLGVATDKSMVHGVKLFYISSHTTHRRRHPFPGLSGTPTRQCNVFHVLLHLLVFLAIPSGQVCKSFDSAWGAGEESTEARNQRHRAWFGKQEQTSKKAVWRPMKRYRTAAKCWLENLDNQVGGGMVKVLESLP
eukprot:1606148-Amphidinium_carterae.1